jgi:hypothetical protein
VDRSQLRALAGSLLAIIVAGSAGAIAGGLVAAALELSGLAAAAVAVPVAMAVAVGLFAGGIYLGNMRANARRRRSREHS